MESAKASKENTRPVSPDKDVKKEEAEADEINLEEVEEPKSPER